MSYEVEVMELPPCDICGEKAKYDAVTHEGPWAYLCEADFQAHLGRLGTGLGQRLVVKRETT